MHFELINFFVDSVKKVFLRTFDFIVLSNLTKFTLHWTIKIVVDLLPWKLVSHKFMNPQLGHLNWHASLNRSSNVFLVRDMSIKVIIIFIPIPSVYNKKVYINVKWHTSFCIWQSTLPPLLRVEVLHHHLPHQSKRKFKSSIVYKYKYHYLVFLFTKSNRISKYNFLSGVQCSI